MEGGVVSRVGGKEDVCMYSMAGGQSVYVQQEVLIWCRGKFGPMTKPIQKKLLLRMNICL